MPFVVCLSLALGLAVGFQFASIDKWQWMYEENDEITLGLGEVEEAINLIERKYYKEVDRDDLVQQALQTITDNLDPFTNYIPEKKVSLTKESLTDSIKGIGVELYKIKDTFRIIHLVADAGAEKAGLSIGSAIMAINGKNLAGPSITFDSLRDQLLERDKATILARHPKTKDTAQFEVILHPIANDEAATSFAINDSIAFIKLDKFNDKSYEHFMRELENLVGDKEKIDLIIDVRDNLGGYLTEVIQMLQQLFDEKNLELLKTAGQHNNEKVYKSRGNNFFNVDQLLILINDRSASASEILSGVVQDWDRGIVVGDTTYGKGLVQEQYDLKSEAALRLTTAYYYLPSGRKIQQRFSGETQDSMEATSKRIGRKLATQDGIVPDVLIENKVPESWYDNYPDIIEYTFNLEIDPNLSMDEIEKEYTLPSSFYGVDQRANAFRNMLFQTLLVQRNKGKKQALQFELLHDPMVQKSIQMIKDHPDFYMYLLTHQHSH